MKKSARGTFDPNSPSLSGSNLFGLNYSVSEAKIVVLPVPWEVTVSFLPGTAAAPAAIFSASHQVDLHDPLVSDAWKIPVAMTSIPARWQRRSRAMRRKAEKYLQKITSPDASLLRRETSAPLGEINRSCGELMRWVADESLFYLKQGKLVAVLGGDHSVPLGLLRSLARSRSSFSVLHIDAHADLRKKYEGFEYSHASIMHHVSALKQVDSVVQVALRDYCDEEVEAIGRSGGKIIPFYDHELKRALYKGENWDSLCRKIVSPLGRYVYLSLDADGLEPSCCPHTGTPVPGGLSFDECVYLVAHLVREGKEIIGFDICESGSERWDANVCARLLFRISNLSALSRGWARLKKKER